MTGKTGGFQRCFALGAAALTIMGLLSIGAAPAEARSKQWAAAHGYRPKRAPERRHYGFRSYRPRKDWDGDGIRNRRDRDVDNDGVRNRFDRDKDGDGRRNRRDYHAGNARRR